MPMRYIIFCITLAFSLIINNNALLAAPRTDGGLIESDIRASNIRKQLKNNRSNIPKELRLRYERRTTYYLIFYDLAGEAIYFRYRKDRFDDLALKRLPSFIKGQAYLLKATFIGILWENQVIMLNEIEGEIKQGVLLFEFQKADAVIWERLFSFSFPMAPTQ